MPPPTKVLNSCEKNWADVLLTACLHFTDLRRAAGPGAARTSRLGVPMERSITRRRVRDSGRNKSRTRFR